MSTALWILAGVGLYFVIFWRFGEVGTDYFRLAWWGTCFVLTTMQHRWGLAAVCVIALCGWAYWLKRDLAKRAQRTERSA